MEQFLLIRNEICQGGLLPWQAVEMPIDRYRSSCRRACWHGSTKGEPPARGADGCSESLVTTVRLEEFVPANQPLLSKWAQCTARRPKCPSSGTRMHAKRGRTAAATVAASAGCMISPGCLTMGSLG